MQITMEPKKFAAALKFRSRDRANITGVCFFDGRMWATNGHVLASFICEDDDSIVGASPVVVTAEMIEGLDLRAPAIKAARGRMTIEEDDDGTVTVRLGDQQPVFGKPLDSFPKVWDAVSRSQFDGAESFQLEASLLKKAAAACKPLAGKLGAMSISVAETGVAWASIAAETDDVISVLVGDKRAECAPAKRFIQEKYVKLLADTMSALGVEHLSANFGHDKYSPMLFQQNEWSEDYVVIMPMRL